MSLTLSNGEIAAIANQFGGFYKDPNLLDPYQDNEWDAYRHAYTSAKFTEEYNASVAKFLGDLKEIHFSLPTEPNDLAKYYSRENMDKWNNNVGREEYQRWQEAKDAGNTTDSLEKWIYDAVKQGKSINDLTDTRQWNFSSSDILQEQLKDDINWLSNQYALQKVLAVLQEQLTDDLNWLNNQEMVTVVQNFLLKFGKNLSDFLTTPANADGIIEDVKQQVTSAKSTSSPIILDLNNNGVETTAVKQGAYFDHANDGFAEQTGWVAANDGLLVRDIDGNGKIDNGGELFGSETLLANGTKAANGFEALKALDSNGDNQINTDDVAFADLKIWIDSNGDGFSRVSELLSLTEAGITAISTAYANSDVVDANGNSHRQLGTYTRADGSQAAAEDVWFAVDHTYSVATTWVNIPDGIASLPNLTGYGVVRDLQQALALDESGSLNQLILNYKNEFDEGQRYSLVNQLIYKWANADSVAPQSRGSYVDARQLVALEHFLGDSFYQTGWGVNPCVTAGKKIAAAFTELSNSITAQLEAQTQFSDLYQQVRWLWDDNSQTLQMDLTSVIAVLQNELNADSANGLAVLDGFVRNLKALGWTNPTVWQSLNDGLVATQPNALETLRLAQLDTLTGNAENNRLDGTVADERLLGFSSDDVLNGQAGNDVLEGGAGQDTIEAGAGNDLLIGGTGNDALDGNAGSDVYSFQQGFGNDHIHQYDSATDSIDTVSFTNLTPQNITQTVRQGDDLTLSFDTSDTLTVDGYFDSAPRRIDIFLFANDEQWDLSSIKARVDTLGMTGDDSLYGYTNGDNRLFGLEGNDDLHGNSGNDYINGRDGNDSLYGQSGDDTLEGGVGNNTLNGGAGKDTFLFNAPLNAAIDKIADFKVTDDTIKLENAIFTQFTMIDVLNPANFVISTTAVDNDDYLIYNKTSGVLSYDADGNGLNKAVQIAILGVNLTLTHADFIVI